MGRRLCHRCVDNHVFAAFEGGTGAFTTPENMVAGQFDGTYLLAIDPKGHVPGEVYDPAVDGPLDGTELDATIGTTKFRFTAKTPFDSPTASP